MIDTAKYIIIEKKGTETAIIFPCWMKHEGMCAMMNVEPKNVLGAGFVRFTIANQKIGVICTGRSVSLNISAKPDDALIIQSQIIDTGE